MPELPEVETTRRGLESHVVGKTISGLTVRQARLRWPIPGDLADRLLGQRVDSLQRRGKYLLLRVETGALLVHLGMSGSLRIVQAEDPPRKHDHVDLRLDSAVCLRFHDPRRFGCLIWAEGDPLAHPLLAELGPEPFDVCFNADYLHQAGQGRQTAVKNFIMDSHTVVGVGNIYANESLFRAKIDPRRAAGRIGLQRYETLVKAIQTVLAEAITQGGTTLRDFVNADSKPGYFQQTLAVYGRTGEPCRVCAKPLRCLRLGQRSTFFCPGCQH